MCRVSCHISLARVLIIHHIPHVKLSFVLMRAPCIDFVLGLLQFYARMLARRLIFAQSQSMDAEEAMINRLKVRSAHVQSASRPLSTKTEQDWMSNCGATRS